MFLKSKRNSKKRCELSKSSKNNIQKSPPMAKQSHRRCLVMSGKSSIKSEADNGHFDMRIAGYFVSVITKLTPHVLRCQYIK